MKALITGGAGFFGTVLKQYLSEKGAESVIYDLVPDTDKVKNTVAVQGDLCNESQLEACFKKYAPFDVVYHVAAQLAHNVKDKNFLWQSNVEGTRRLVEVAVTVQGASPGLYLKQLPVGNTHGKKNCGGGAPAPGGNLR